MKLFTRIFVIVLFIFGGTLLAQAQDASGCKDHPLFNRMPGYAISRCEVKDFDSHPFRDKDQKEIAVEGRLTIIRYALQEGIQEPSRVQIFRNYENAITKIGGTVLAETDDGDAYMKVVKGDKEIWVHVSAYITSEWMLTIVEKQAMTQVVVANAEALSDDINSTGHAAIYGVYFDTGKADVKPESEKALKEIARLLTNNAGLKLNVVGHTDGVGPIEVNMKLSQGRAESVVQALVSKYGIAAARLKGYGVGPLAPVASNDAEAGRSRNRRVELVKQ